MFPLRPCSSCGAAIGFLDTRGGRTMPVDPGLIKTFLAPPSIGDRVTVLITERGEIRRGREVSLTDPTGEAVEGYVTHWSTCSTSAVHRKATRKEG